MEKKAKEIREACLRQYKKIGAVLPPQYCLVCQGCALGAIVQALSELEP